MAGANAKWGHGTCAGRRFGVESGVLLLDSAPALEDSGGKGDAVEKTVGFRPLFNYPL